MVRWVTLGALGVIVSASACSGASTTATTGPGSSSSQWPGFVDLGAFGEQCTAAIATAPASAFGPMTFIPCTSGETGCEELKWDGAITWDPAGGGDMLVFDVQLVHDASGRSTRALLRHHYTGKGYGTLPYEAVLYDVASGAPLFALRNVGGGAAGGGAFGGGSDCFVVPVASPDGVWLAGTGGSASGVQVAYTAVPAQGVPSFRASSVDASFVNNVAVAFDDRLALSQDDGQIVVAGMTQDASSYGPGERVWLSSTVGNRFLTVNPNASDGMHYFTLDGSMQFAPYGGKDEISSDGAEIAYWTTSGATVQAWTASATDGTSGARQLASVSNPSGSLAPGYLGSAVGDGNYALLTYASTDFSPGGPVTATVVALATGAASTTPVTAQVPMTPQMPGSRVLLGYVKPYLWLGEYGDNQGIAKIVRIRAPAP